MASTGAICRTPSTPLILCDSRHANAMARRLSQRISGVEGVRQMAPVEANGVFLELSPRLQQRLRQQGWRFYTFLGDEGCRLLCSWDTTPEVVDRFAADLAAAAAQAEA